MFGIFGAVVGAWQQRQAAQSIAEEAKRQRRYALARSWAFNFPYGPARQSKKDCYDALARLLGDRALRGEIS